MFRHPSEQGLEIVLRQAGFLDRLVLHLVVESVVADADAAHQADRVGDMHDGDLELMLGGGELRVLIEAYDRAENRGKVPFFEYLFSNLLVVKTKDTLFSLVERNALRPAPD